MSKGLIALPVVVAGVNDNTSHALMEIVTRHAGWSPLPETQTVAL